MKTDGRAAASMLVLVLLTAVACGGAEDAGPTTTGDVTPTVGDEGGPQTLEECVASEGWQLEEYDESATFPRLQDFLDANDIVSPVGVVEPQGSGFQFAALWAFEAEEDAQRFAETLPIIVLPPVGLAPEELLSVRSEGTLVVATTEGFSSSDALLKCG